MTSLDDEFSKRSKLLIAKEVEVFLELGLSVNENSAEKCFSTKNFGTEFAIILRRFGFLRVLFWPRAGSARLGSGRLGWSAEKLSRVNN